MAPWRPYSIEEGTSGGNSRIYFDNAVLRALSGATNAFMSGLESRRKSNPAG